ncbi:MAG: STAS domain-containing protein [Vicinamibacterales bacterium]
MIVQTRQEGAIPVVTVTGRIDPTTSPQLQDALDALLPGSGYRAVLDLTGVTFISSSGLRVFISVQKKVTSLQGDLKLCGMNSNVETVFRIAGLLKIFDVASTEADALKKFPG